MNRPCVTLLLAAALVACGPSRPRPPINVVLIVVDTLRSDHLGPYGASRPTSPALDALAAEGTVFERAYSTAPWTKPSMASLFTGLYPRGHALRGMRRKLADGNPTLAQVLRDRGYATAGIVSNTLLSAQAGFGRGLDVYLEDQAQGAGYISSEGVAREAVEQLDRLAAGKKPFFLFVHFFDPHADYKRHLDVGFAKAPAGRLVGNEPQARLRALQSSMSPEEVEFVRAVYDEEVRHTDSGIAQVLDHLRALGRWRDTAVVVTADHGEELHDHGVFGHTRSLYDELIHVPLIVRAPGAPGARRVKEPVSLASLFPTVLELAGVGPVLTPSRALAPSLVPALDGVTTQAPSEIYSEVDFLPVDPDDPVGEVHKMAMISDSMKVILDDGSTAIELYDLAADPGELVDLSRSRSGLARRMAGRLQKAMQALTRVGAQSPEQQFSREELERLRSLGYVGH